MKELSDKKFDELLKQKAESFDFDFDESAWNKMEQKLRKRDRAIFIRNSSFVLILLLLAGGIYFFLDNKPLNETTKIAKGAKSTQPQLTSVDKNEQRLHIDENNTVTVLKDAVTLPQNIQEIKSVNRTSEKKVSTNPQSAQNKTVTETSIVEKPDELEALARNQPEVPGSTVPISDITNGASSFNPGDTSVSNKEAASRSKNKKLAFSVTALAGPEFSSVKSIAGKQGTITLGILLNAAISNKITVSSGLKYGLKNYQAGAYDYQMQNQTRAGMLSGIDASCAILEIPLQASYTLLNNSNKRISVSSGLSSYLMLKEKYHFKYTPQSGYNDYLLEKKNANQHYFSVLSLSASYHIRPKASHVEWAIEPYVKLPLGGVGEGNVRLKSSGISLNLSYDLGKKNK
ncbi:hypothetical protein WG906_10195 [Pedobacter sp. P351]|uniref:hypothetical protein n=1 Tax=Pedobacter superstes TaxID=3133441 RepID=UPI0030A87A76